MTMMLVEATILLAYDSRPLDTILLSSSLTMRWLSPIIIVASIVLREVTSGLLDWLVRHLITETTLIISADEARTIIETSVLSITATLSSIILRHIMVILLASIINLRARLTVFGILLVVILHRFRLSESRRTMVMISTIVPMITTTIARALLATLVVARLLVRAIVIEVLVVFTSLLLARIFKLLPLNDI